MSDLISKSKLVDSLICCKGLGRYSLEAVIKTIEEQPTVDEKEIIRKPIERIVERMDESTEFLKDCTKYGNKNAEQQHKSYSTMMMYEVADLVDDLIEIVREEGGV